MTAGPDLSSRLDRQKTCSGRQRGKHSIETLEFYASVAYTNFVEMTRHVDDLSWVAPSDYVLIDDTGRCRAPITGPDGTRPRIQYPATNNEGSQPW
jgi:hypothetical protein